MSSVVVARSGSVTTLTLDRAERRNALDAETERAIVAALADAAADDEVHVVLLDGNGPSFCSGHDVSAAAVDGGVRPEAVFDSLRLFYDEVLRFPKPLVVAAHGVIGPAGVELLLLADLVVAAESTVLSYEIYRAGGMTPAHLLPWMVGLREAKRILLTAPRVSAVEAERHGIVTRVVPDAELGLRARALADLVAAMPPLHLRLAKAAVNQCLSAMGAGSVAAVAASSEALLRLTTPSVDATLDAGGLAALLADQAERFGPLVQAWDGEVEAP